MLCGYAGSYFRQALTALLLAIAAFSTAAVPVITETEPNDTSGTATVLTLNVGRAMATGAISTPGDVDYFRFTAPAGARIWALVDTGGTQAAGATSRDSMLDLLAADGTTILESDDNDGVGNGGGVTIQSGNASIIAGTTLASGGTYYLRVRAVNSSVTIDPYRLMLVVTTGPARIETEPNNTSGSGEAILSGARTTVVIDGAIAPATSDQDVFTFPLDAGDTVFFAADADPARTGSGIDLVVDVLGPSGAPLFSADSSGSGSISNPPAEGATYTAAVTGQHSVRVRPFNLAASGPYRLMVANMTRPDRTIMDIDGDGNVVPTIDGLLLMRWMLGMRGSALLGGISFPAEALRTTVPDIELYFQLLDSAARPW